ncbi:response regulator [Paenibacillus sp. 1011MAR3C5]|uniref:response regulator n=1 Tax=Paenibacillus sp. 1011MAR3C5 TaxID=1675787 RepID=UPI000E6C22E0|nr:response regulator [Paenibacillus sp. 1011MAR3C5]RJE90335.1 response regulator [Paenibacillus sp. 1011MAR3C5]
MYKVLIVDDEHLVRYGIKAMIDWESIGFQVVGEASNGREGLQAFQELAPDVLITDIKMPVMDGMELIAQVRMIDRDAKLILLTCLEDFEYAQRALRLGTTDYLIKSNMMPQDMESVMLVLKGLLDEERADQGKLPESGEDTAEAREAIAMDALLMGLAHGTISAGPMTGAMLQTSELNNHQGELVLLHIGLDYMENVTQRFSENELIRLHTEGASIVRHICSAEKYGIELFSSRTGEWNVLLKNAGESHAEALGQAIINRLSEVWNESATVGISSAFHALTELREAYIQAEQGYRLKLFLGCGSVIRADARSADDSTHQPAPIMNKKLNDFLYSLDSEAMRTYIDHVFNDAEARLDVERAQLISIELLLNLTNMYTDLTHDHEWLYDRKKELYDQIKELETLSDRKRWFVQVYEELIHKVRSVYSSDQGSIPKIIAFIDQNYDKELSLQILSEHVHLSKNYLANLFKKETGEGVIDYITRVRMDRAKSLLRGTDLKSSEISLKVGIPDSKYFSKLFKKMTGVTPSEYREAAHATSHL